MRSYTSKLLPSTLAAFALYSATAYAQEETTPTPPAAPPAVDSDRATPADIAEKSPVATIEEHATTETTDTTDAVAETPTAPPAPAAPVLPGEEEVAIDNAEAAPEQEEFEDGMRLNNADLNTVFEVLARDAGLSYFHNNRIAGEEFKVNGYLRDGDAITQMEDLAFNNALSLHRRGNTIYALTKDQLSQLPATEWHYNLRYLRSSNMKEHIRELVSPLLSPNTGIVNYEEKTNTLIVIDTPYKVERVKSLLERIDRAKGQIVVEVKIYRVNTSAGQSLGVNWSNTLGPDSTVPLNISLGINDLLGLPSSGVAPLSAGDLVLSPDAISATLTALNEGGIIKLQNNPVIITEDNEAASITVIDRIPIITTESTQNTSGGNPTVTEEVRYKIDEEDSTDPENTREIGTTIFVTPTLLPDGTIRLSMRPRAASVTRQVESLQTGNLYPEVRESTLTTIARIPDGHSLIVGGFFQESETEEENKVPLLGDIPVINFFFKSKETSKVQSSLLFVVTPSSYSPENHASHHRTHNRLESTLQVRDKETTWDDPANYDLEKPNLNRTWNNIKKESGLYNNQNSSAPTTNKRRSHRR
ncbi:type II secretion system protein GspD [Rubritalea spongiae]|uniref:Type II secretion system protein GspD n=1 Tax=Rubritalea spongiae TaxID=430797 RepID=A0ABW5E5C6_9BACT